MGLRSLSFIFDPSPAIGLSLAESPRGPYVPIRFRCTWALPRGLHCFPEQRDGGEGSGSCTRRPAGTNETVQGQEWGLSSSLALCQLPRSYAM